MKTFGSRIVCAGLAVVLTTLFVVAAQSPSHADEAYCDQRAHRFAERHTRGQGTLAGGLFGGTIGAIIGRGLGGRDGTGIGALIGGTTGALFGSEDERRRYEELYDEAYERCMDRVSARDTRAYQPGPVQLHQTPPEPWTEEWYDYCHAKYRSFNEETGEYQTYSGEYRMCR